MRRFLLLSLLLPTAAIAPAAAYAIPDGGIELVSRPSGFGPLPFDGAAYAGANARSVSADGCKVVFQSDNDVLSDLDDDAGSDVFRVDRCAPGQPVVLVSATATGVPGDSGSFAPTISADGNRVAFTTRATNLRPPGTTAYSSVVVKDIPSGSLMLASRDHGADTPAANAYTGVISGDGKAVAFEATGPVDANNADGSVSHSDVYVRFLAGFQTVMVSVKGGASGGAGSGFDISYDGSKVAFASATSFTAGDTDSSYDAYLADVSPAGNVAFRLASAGAHDAREAAISGDGSLVAFGDDHVWVTDCSGSPCGTPAVVDPAAPGTQSVYGVGFPRSAPHPAHVYWSTDAALGPNDTNGEYDLYVGTLPPSPQVKQAFGSPIGGTGAGDMTDDLSVVVAQASSLELPGTDGSGTQVFARTAGGVTLLSQPAGSPPRRNEVGDSIVARGALSENARFVAMETRSAALGAPLEPARMRFTQQAAVRDIAAGVTTLVSVAADGSPASGSSGDASIDAAGARVAFMSRATNLVPGVPAAAPHVYVRDLATGTTQLIDRNAAGAPAADGATQPSIARDGSKVAFLSSSADLPGANGYPHAYVADLATGAITLVDQTAAGVVSNGSAEDLIVDGDGSRAAFVSRALNLGAGSTGGKVFLKDLRSGELTYVSVPQSGTPAQHAYNVSIDAAGDRVSWEEYSATFGYGSDGQQHVFLRDLPAGTTVIASVGGDTVAGAYEGDGELDRAGMRLSFLRTAPGGLRRPYVRDLAAGATLALLPNGPQDTFRATLSPDGICVGLTSRASGLVENGPSPDFAQTYVRAAGGDCAPRAAGSSSQLGGGTGGAGAVADSTPPRISRLHMTRRRFRVRRRASAFVFVLSEDARVSVAVRRRHKVVATLTRGHARAGRNRIVFSGRIGKRKLKPGPYRATVGAIDAAGNRGAPRNVRFRIVRR